MMMHDGDVMMMMMMLMMMMAGEPGDEEVREDLWQDMALLAGKEGE